MARRRLISKSKIRVRYVFRRFAENEVATIDRFREHVHDAAAAQQRLLESRADDLSEEALEFLAEDLRELDSISDLADQLAIVALYRVAEVNTGRILAHRFGPTASAKAVLP